MKHTEELPWPVTADGEPEEPVFVGSVGGTDLDFEMTVSMLRGYGIPTLRSYPQAGRFMRVVFGFTGAGMDIYVPKSMGELALALINGEGEIEENDGES